jgi:hypothetical protein
MEKVMTTTYAVKIENGQAKVYDARTGAFKQSFGHDVVSAQVDGELLQYTDKKGSVNIYDVRTGAFKRSL